MSIIKYNNKELTLKTATKNPRLAGRTVIVSNRWEYVRFFLKNIRRNKIAAENALFYWNQAEEFYKSSKGLSMTSAPLPLYYCFLNATKALLEFKDPQNQHYSQYHGLSGHNGNVNISKPKLDEQTVTIKFKGVCPALLNFLDGSMGAVGQTYPLGQLLANLVYIHRTYAISQNISHSKEMFIPLEDVFFIRKPDKYVTVNAKIDQKYLKHTNVRNNTLPKVSVYENDGETKISWKRARVKLKDIRNVSSNQSLVDYHRLIRKYFHEISSGINSRWYFKDTNNSNNIDIPPLVIMYMCMHRLSELSRYEPNILKSYLEKEHSWLLSEFISATPFQFINMIASEITDEQLGIPRQINEI